MSRRSWRAAAVLSLLAVLPRCAKDPTGFYVTVNVPTGVRFLSVSVVHPTMTMMGMGMGGQVPLIIAPQPPITVTSPTMTFIVQRSGRYPSVTIEVQGSVSEIRPMTMVTAAAYDRATVTYVDDTLLDLTMTLRAPCQAIPVPCPGTQRCGATTNQCEESTVRNLQRHDW
jgi:hypothetical protein